MARFLITKRHNPSTVWIRLGQGLIFKRPLVIFTRWLGRLVTSCRPRSFPRLFSMTMLPFLPNATELPSNLLHFMIVDKQKSPKSRNEVTQRYCTEYGHWLFRKKPWRIRLKSRNTQWKNCDNTSVGNDHTMPAFSNSSNHNHGYVTAFLSTRERISTYLNMVSVLYFF